jgi:ABC-type nitrate/sulfonate/bicarbonate transport system substrate-binding protein
VAVSLASACQPWPRPPLPQPPTSPTPLLPRREVVVGLSAQPRYEEAPLVDFAASPALAEQRLGLRLIRGHQLYDALPLLAAERAQLGLLDVSTVLRAVDQRLDLVSVFQLYPADVSMLFCLQRSGVRNVADLLGKRVAVRAPETASAYALAAALQVDKQPPAAVELVNRDQPREALERNDVAAAVAPGYQAVWLEARSLAVTRLPIGDWTRVPGLSLVCLRDFAAHEGPLLKSFALALQQHLRATLASPQPLASLIGEQFPVSPDERPALAAASAWLVQALRPLQPEHDPGWADAPRFTAAARLLHDLGATSTLPDLTRVYLNDFLPGAR